MITSVGQKTDTKIPETITALTGVAKTAMTAGMAGGLVDFPKPTKPQPKECVVSGNLYHLDENGRPDRLVTLP